MTHATRHRAAGALVSKTERVVIPQEYLRSPTYHAIDDYTDKDAPITACKRILSPYDPLLRLDHADSFGRPCKRCFDV